MLTAVCQVTSTRSPLLTWLPCLLRQCQGAVLGLGGSSSTASASQYATSTANEQQQKPLTLKAALRQLYLRVHPDLFHDYPAEKVSLHPRPLHIIITRLKILNGVPALAQCAHNTINALTCVPLYRTQAENERSFKLLQVSKAARCWCWALVVAVPLDD